ncbi:YqgU-like beta propeller domain-containing protein [Bacillus solitudinis]|uniref:YqgU-like beta propeller domain-containing protein n=1 Tax=Bacillus solitudinis TaxID=2014074 RepID=UPI000C243F05|nr:hypothetical protein [Bacillus solitudinis]
MVFFRWVLLFIFLITCVGCFSTKLEGQPSPGSLSDIPKKRNAPSSFFSGSPISPLFENETVSSEIQGWFNETSVLYLTEREELFSLVIHDVHSGETMPFFDTEDWIINIRENHDYSLFAIQTVNEEDESKVLIVDSSGQIQMEIEDFGEDYSVYWSSFNRDEFILIAYLPDWELDVYFIKASEQKVKPLPIEQSYIQWVSEQKIAYLNWDQLEPSYHAPLVFFNLDTQEEQTVQDDIIAFVNASPDISFTVTVDTIYDLHSDYTFHDFRNESIVSHLDMPILNTYSEQWWIPFHTFGKKDEIIYYLRPKYSGDYFSYSDGYDLMAYYVRTNTGEKLSELKEHVPLAISPKEDYILVGNSFEQIFDIASQTMYPMYE